MRASSITLLWMGSAFAAATVLAAIVLTVFGAGKPGTVDALQLTARFSFLLFWLAYAGGGLVVLLGPTLQPLRRHGRELGLAFVSAHQVHIALVVWLCWIGAAPAADVFRFFLPPLAVVYILALFSIGSLQKVLSRTQWAVLRTVGMTYIAYAFAADFLTSPLSGNRTHIIMYAPFAAMSIAGPVLHVLSLVPSLRRWRQPLAQERHGGVRIK